MLRSFKTLAVIFMLFAAVTSLHADERIKIKIKQPPPNMLGVGDMWNLTLENTTKNDLKIYLTGTATEDKDGLIIEGKSKVFTVKPGKTNYKYNDFSGAEVKYNNGKYKEIILRTGNAPEGSYTICVTAFEESGEIAGMENCIMQTVQQLGSITLISPENGAELDPDTLPGLVFSWTPLPKGGPYSLRIVELKGDQSPDVAIKENRPILDVNDIKSTTYQGDPVHGVVVKRGYKYAWQVTSGDVVSEVQSFVLAPGMQSINLELTPSTNAGCCFDMKTIGNFDPFYTAFKISSVNSITSITPASGYQIQNQTTNEATLLSTVGLPFTPNTFVGTICFNQVSGEFPAAVLWSTNAGVVFMTPADSLKLKCPTETGNCVDFEGNYNSSLWYQYNVSSIQTLTNNSDPVNSTSVLQLTDGSGGSVAINNTDFSGNWIERGEDGCLCFDYKADYNPNVTCPPGQGISNILKIWIYTGPVINSLNSFYNCTRAVYISNPSQPNIPDNEWGHYCLPIRLSSNGNLPSDGLGSWYVYQNGVLLTGTAACTEWDILIQNVTGLILGTDYNCQPSEIISFDNFCWQCTPTVSTNPCNEYQATVQSNSTQGGCCWSLSLQQPTNGPIVKSVRVLPILPATLITGSVNVTSPSLALGTSNANRVDLVPVFPSPNIPSGNLSNVLNFCMNFSSPEQKVVIQWMGGRNNDSLICSDTLTTYCEVSCVENDSMTTICKGSGFTFDYRFKNVSTFPITGLEFSILSPLTATITSPTALNFSPHIGINNYGNASIDISNAPSNSEVCVLVKYLSPDSCCYCYDTLCIATPSCICDSTTLDSWLMNGNPNNCCYDIRVKNLNVTDFSHLEINSLSTNVFFQSQSYSTGWSGQTVGSTPTQIIAYNSAYPVPLPTGANINVLNFCLAGYTTLPQFIELKWMRSDSVICRDTLVTNCIPPPPEDTCSKVFDDTLICNPDNTFTYNFRVANFSSWDVRAIKLSPSSPTGLNITPFFFDTDNLGNPIYIIPGGVSPMLSTTISGVGQNTQLCFKVGIYDHPVNHTECCWTEDYCITTPNCGDDPRCFESTLDSIWCIKDSLGVKRYGYAIDLTNYTASSNNYVLSNSCGTFSSINYGSIPAGNTITHTGQFTTTQTGNCCITAQMWIPVSPQNIDTCYDTLCFQLPPCGQVNPCTVSVTGGPQSGDTLCKGSPVTITWTSNTSGNVNISLVNVNSWSVYQTIATNVPNTGSYNWTLPSGIPCDSVRKWQFYVENVERTCWNYGPVFHIKCCDTVDCDSAVSGFTVDDTICYGSPVIIDGSSSINEQQYFISVQESDINWNRYGVEQMEWFAGPAGTFDIKTWYLSKGVDFECGKYYRVKLAVSNSCTKWNELTKLIYIKCCDSSKCDCKGWDKEKGRFYYVQDKLKNESEIKCGGKYKVDKGSSVTFNPAYICEGDGCLPRYSYSINGLDVGFKPSPYSVGPVNVNTTVKIYAWCGDKVCDTCLVYIKVPPLETGCECGSFSDKIVSFETIWGASGKIGCGDKVQLTSGASYTFTGPAYNCNPNNKSCNPVYTWFVNGVQQATSQNLSYTFNNPNSRVTVKVSCGGKVCDSCNFTVVLPEGCKCGSWMEGISVNGYRYPCNQSPNFMFYQGNLNIQGPALQCDPYSPNCQVQFTYSIKVDQVQVHSGSGTSFSNFYFQPFRIYDIIFNASCGGIQCPPCMTTIHVTGGIIWEPGGVVFGNIGIKNPNVFPAIFNPTGSVRPDFGWSNSGNSKGKKLLSLVEIKPGSDNVTLSDELKKLPGTEPLFEVMVESNSLKYPEEAKDLTIGSYYIWVVYETDEKGNATVFEAGLFKAGSDTAGVILDNCDSSKKCKSGVRWDIGGKCICF